MTRSALSGRRVEFVDVAFRKAVIDLFFRGLLQHGFGEVHAGKVIGIGAEIGAHEAGAAAKVKHGAETPFRGQPP